MKNFLVLIAFVISLIAGLMLSSASNPLFLAGKSMHRDCVRWDKETIGKSLFTLEEIKKISHKKVISNNPEFKFGETGRIIAFEAVGENKFLIEIYWGNGVNDENSSVTFHDKDWFYKDFEIVN